MKRMGFFTGKLYDETINTEDIKECCFVLNYKEPIYNDEELVKKKRVELKQRCIGCHQCEEAQNS